jgi:DNA-binding GntR family transcriptional regulator
MSKKIINGDLKNTAYKILREKLINCEYPPGSLLNETQLSEELGFSRTPIRESISKLEQDGFIQVLPKKGIYVRDISLNDVTQIFQTRVEIEPVALRLAGPHLPKDELLHFYETFSGEEFDVKTGFRVDMAMHLFIIENCGNRFIIDMMHKLFDENTRVVLATGQNETKIHDARLEHLDVLMCLIDEKWDIAAETMRKHIESCRRAALDFIYSSSYEQHKHAHTDRYKQELQKAFVV